MTEQVWHVMPGEWAVLSDSCPLYMLIRPDELNAGVPVAVIVDEGVGLLLIDTVVPGVLLRNTPPDPYPEGEHRHEQA